MNRIFFICLSLLTGIVKSQQQDTLQLFFEIDQVESEQNYRRMDSMFQSLSGKFISFEVTGFADFLHNPDYNLKLSQARADAVKNYLEKKAAPGQIQSITSKAYGEKFSSDNASRSGEPFQRRVDVIIKPLVIIEHYEEKAPAEPVKKDTSEMASLEKLGVGESLAIKGINFEPGRHFLTKESVPVLKELLQILKENPNLKIEIQGHICCLQEGFDGLDFDTQERKLSYNRAQVVYNYLVKNGIDPGRLTYKGYGRTRPKVDPEMTPADEQANRRVEIMVTEK